MTKHTITATCEKGHVQSFDYRIEGFMDSREFVEGVAGLMDGTSPMYVHSPIGTDSVIGKCGICGSQIKCTVEEIDGLSEPLNRAIEEIADAVRNNLEENPPRGLNPSPVRDVTAVDRSARELSNGGPVTDDHRQIGPDGQQKGYVVLTGEERAKGFMRPVRRTYIHVGKPPEGERFEYPIRKVFPGGCGSRTTMATPIAETYARDPGFYSGTFCCECCAHFPLDQFVWEGTTEQVGS